jgi:hypothetical protein
MKWTFQQYDDQPAYFIDIVIMMLRAEANASKNHGSN